MSDEESTMQELTATTDTMSRGRKGVPKSATHRANIAAGVKAMRQLNMRPAMDRFTEKYVVNVVTGCWEWQAQLDEDGYALFSYGSRCRRAFRWIYQQRIGPIPDSLVLDHTCRNRICVNPHHAEPVTNKVNVLRGFGPPAMNARATHCKHGHPFDQTNTHMHNGKRRCRACSRRIAAECRQRKVA